MLGRIFSTKKCDVLQGLENSIVENFIRSIPHKSGGNDEIAELCRTCSTHVGEGQ